MLTTFLIIGWIACGMFAIYWVARKDGELKLSQVLAGLLIGPAALLVMIIFYADETVIWRRKPDDQPREDL